MKLSTLYGLGQRMCVRTGQQLSRGVRESAFRSKGTIKIVQRKVAQLRVAIRLVVFPYMCHASVHRRHVCVCVCVCVCLVFFSGTKISR